MLGKPKHCQPKLFYHGISLEERIPPDHPLRRIKQRIDFGIVRSQVADRYGRNGHESLDPVVLLKFMFLLFYENVPSERQLFEQLPLRLDWLWFCDYDLDETTPHHSVLSKVRRRWGVAVFEQFFLNILEQCFAAGLIDGRTIHVDASLIDGNVDICGVRPHLRRLCQELTQKLDDTDEESLSSRINPVDPDARIGCKPGETVLGYKDHRVVDDQHGIITATITTPANVHDAGMLIEAVETHEENLSCPTEMVVADTIYGTTDNYEYLHEQGKRCCIPHQRHGVKANDAFSHDQFTYDAARDCYWCPTEQMLRRYDHRSSQDGGIRYRADRATCEACPHFAECVQSKVNGRQIRRNEKADLVTWADTCGSRAQRHRLQTRRRYKAEGSFADGANNHGFKRARWRGLANMTIQNLIIAAVQNLRKLLRYGVFDPASTIGRALGTLVFMLFGVPERARVFSTPLNRGQTF